MQRTIVTCLTAALLILLVAGHAVSALSTISYQGRLTNSAGTPVADGSYAVTFSIWTDSVAGSMIWSESQNIQVSGGGLFATQLGGLQPLGGELISHGGDDLYLQASLAGTPLLPRLAVGSVPHAVISSSLNHTVPGVGSMHMSVGTDTTKISSSHESATGIIDSYIHITEDRALMGLKAYDPVHSSQSSYSSRVSADSSRNFLDYDDDADGIPEQEISSAIVPTRAQHAVNTKGTGAQSGRVVSITSGTDVDSASLDLSTDDDGDGIAEAKVKLAAGASLLGSALPGGAIVSALYDSDDDGTPEQEISSAISPTTAKHAVNTKGTGAQSGRSASIASGTDIDSAAIEILGQDATSAGQVRLNAQPSGTTLVNVSSIDASSGTPIIKGSALMTTSAVSGVQHKFLWDTDADGVADRRITEDCDDDDAGIEIVAGVAIPKFINVTAQAQAAAQKADIGMLMGVGSDTTIKIGADDDEAGVTIQSGVAIPRFIEMNAKSQSSAHQASVGLVMGAGPDTAVVVHSDDSETKVRFKAPQDRQYSLDFDFTAASGSVSMTDSLGAISMQMDGDGRLGVGGPAHASNPIDHPSSGAHLTPGGVWTNASDENLKENFQTVDGADLLEKIEQLPISEWNYKNESDETKHIGPTAQDFQKIFGVGSDGKSISTIDPSGIALAAIKELNKKLEQENKALRTEMDELKKLVQQLASQK